MRPDPHSISRRPMASTDAKVVITRPSEIRGELSPIFEADGLDLNALHALVEQAVVVAEGRTDQDLVPPRFFGSWTVALQPSEIIEGSVSLASASQRLSDAFDTDERARRVIEDKTFRELSRLLGVDTSVDFECQIRTVPDGSIIRIVVDFECPIKPIQKEIRAQR